MDDFQMNKLFISLVVGISIEDSTELTTNLRD